MKRICLVIKEVNNYMQDKLSLRIMLSILDDEHSQVICQSYKAYNLWL